jgi:hypothetical protein
VFGAVSGQRLGQSINANFNVSGNAPKFACRAWVHFDGTTSPGTIRASGNVSSVTKIALGNFRVNFTTVMQDASYVVTSTAAQLNQTGMGIQNSTATNYTNTGVRIIVSASSASTLADFPIIGVVVFR